ncbi:mitochondrial protein Pet127-domain-containing protein [Cokeromyces recurvatus]|uniref:mitochondrial protein Pet127-domain-containing protein n=1 Tax=Cokeromyces recurvatus TaxID=90255 RepID=UPI00221F3080|nr:mitochondrial protein Pet127-domain-containing protein [Cokeromyces recurvatus]KAI7897550.1 mitochondrial protein Pet127-domain-containing protein [Cokeromyces recurvatus]
MLSLSHQVIRKYESIPSLFQTIRCCSTESSPIIKKEAAEVFFDRCIKGCEKQVVKKKHISLSKRLKKIGLKPVWQELSKDVEYTRVEPPSKVPVATLAHGLDRVLFNPGVHYLKDPRTNHYNFTPFLENITQPKNFDFETIKPYITSSKDESLIELAKSLNKSYVGSTSSVSAILSQFYFLMCNFKQINASCFSNAFRREPKKFTRGIRMPVSIYLRWNDGVYGIDLDKAYDLEETVLSLMGKSLEKALTLEPNEYERYLKDASSKITEEERNKPESYAYGEFGGLLLRSQLDCHDSRLPRSTFDLKTRAAIPIRLDVQNYTDYAGYTLRRSHGLYESFEREYYDMTRSAFLKYNFQVRIGHMDGILVAYHNTQKIFGFQYISREEMDTRLFGSSKIGNQVFRNSLNMFEFVLNKATEKYPKQTLRISFDTRQNKNETESMTYIYVEAVPDSQNKEEDSTDEFFQMGEENRMYEPYKEITMYELLADSHINGKPAQGSFNFKLPYDWNLRICLREICENDDEGKRNRFRAMRKTQAGVRLAKASRPNPILLRLKKISETFLRGKNKE